MSIIFVVLSMEVVQIRFSMGANRQHVTVLLWSITLEKTQINNFLIKNSVFLEKFKHKGFYKSMNLKYKLY